MQIASSKDKEALKGQAADKYICNRRQDTCVLKFLISLADVCCTGLRAPRLRSLRFSNTARV